MIRLYALVIEVELFLGKEWRNHRHSKSQKPKNENETVSIRIDSHGEGYSHASANAANGFSVSHAQTLVGSV